MRQTDALAQVYARSLIELARDAGGEEKILEVGGELEQICEIARRDHAFREFLSSPIIDATSRATSLRSMFSNRVTDLTLRFMLVLNSKGRLGHLESINTAYDQYVQDAFGRIEVDVITATAIDDGTRQVISERIRAAVGKEPVLHHSTDPSIIGGLKLRIGDQLIDGSIASDIRRLRQNMLTKGSAKLRERFTSIIEGGGTDSGAKDPTT